MIRDCCSGSGWLLLLATLRAVLAHAANAEVETLTSGKTAVNDLWTTADTITVSILPLNFSHHEFQVLVQLVDDTSEIRIETLTGQQATDLDVLAPIKHKVEELQPDTRYELCVVLSEQDNPQLGSQQTECYKVKTFPRLDNVRGIYAALTSVVVFLLACGLTWLIYKLFWVRYFTKVLKVQDSHQVEQQVEGQSSSSHGQEAITSESGSSVSTTTMTT